MNTQPMKLNYLRDCHRLHTHLTQRLRLLKYRLIKPVLFVCGCLNYRVPLKVGRLATLFTDRLILQATWRAHIMEIIFSLENTIHDQTSFM